MFHSSSFCRLNLFFISCLTVSACSSVSSNLPDHSILNISSLPAIALDTSSEADSKTLFKTIDESSSIDNILYLSPSFKEKLDQRIGHIGSSRKKADQLLRFLFDERELGLKYQYSNTTTAMDTLESGSGNCLSISHLVIASARYLGIEAQYQEVIVEQSWNRVGDVYFLDRHINVRLTNLASGIEYEVDMRPFPTNHSRRTQLISDHTAFAHYFNNRAAESMAEKKDNQAFLYYQQALQADANLAFIWANLGTLYLRYQQQDAAELVLQQALALNPDEYIALNNLAWVYSEQGDTDRAKILSGKADKVRQKNPYFLAYLAETAFNEGELEIASMQISRALELELQDFTLHLLASRIFAEMDKADLAARHFQLAERNLANSSEALSREQQTQFRNLSSRLNNSI